MQEELEAFYNQASNSETIRDNLTEAANLLAEEEQGIMTQMRDLSSLFSTLSSYSPQYSELYERIDTAYIELDDLSREVYDLAENVEFDPKKLARAQKKLQKLYDLQKKHKVSTVSELILIKEALEEKVSQMENIEGDIEIAQKEVEKAFQTLSTLAQKLHKVREKVIPTLTKSLQDSLKDLGMPNAQFQISLTPTEHYQAKGNDSLSFLFLPTKGVILACLRKPPLEGSFPVSCSLSSIF